MRRFNELEEDEQSLIGSFIMGMVTTLFLLALYMLYKGGYLI